MRQSTFAPLLDQFSNRPLFTSAEARAASIPSRMLAHFQQQGLLERLSRGIYRCVNADTGIDFEVEELVLTALSIPNGVVCLLSALCLYQLTDQLMREYWIAIPNSSRSPKRNHARIIRMRNITLGLSLFSIGKYDLKIFDRERTIVDAFRYLSHEIAIKALQTYLTSQKADLVKLSEYAKKLRVNITPYILALTT